MSLSLSVLYDVSLNKAMYEVIVGVLATGAMAMAGWAVAQVIKVPSIEEKLNHVVGRVDDIYKHLLGPEGGPHQR
jgi:hypothetical protein